jgi:hypothetical protein
MPELVIEGETGYKTEVLYKPWMQNGSYAGVPSTQSVFDCIMKVYKQDREKMGKRARDWMVKDYDTKTIFNSKWKPYLENLESELVPSDRK